MGTGLVEGTLFVYLFIISDIHIIYLYNLKKPWI